MTICYTDSWCRFNMLTRHFNNNWWKHFDRVTTCTYYSSSSKLCI